MRSMLVTGGAGFIGSHAAEHFAQRGYRVTILDNLSRGWLLKREDPNALHNWEHLGGVTGVTRVRGDVCDPATVAPLVADAQVILHAAAQTAVTTSVTDPQADFHNNALGTFTVLDAARRAGHRPAVVFCSTNKVYGENVNAVPVVEEAGRYRFDAGWEQGIPENFSIDRCEHTPYGCSKLTGDLYAQDFGHLYGLRAGIFRMSCIYGTRQFGMEDQGWVAWFVIAALSGRPITIFGDGKQVRDVLWIDDLLAAYEAFLESDLRLAVFNMGGGPQHTLSLLELLDLIRAETGITPQVGYSDWRPSDQRVYISDTRAARTRLGWEPRVAPAEGVRRLIAWTRAHSEAFARQAAR